MQKLSVMWNAGNMVCELDFLWLPFRSNGRTMDMASPLTKLARHFIENDRIVKIICDTLTALQ